LIDQLTFDSGHEADVVDGVVTRDFARNLAVVWSSHRSTQLSCTNTTHAQT